MIKDDKDDGGDGASHLGVVMKHRLSLVKLHESTSNVDECIPEAATNDTESRLRGAEGRPLPQGVVQSSFGSYLPTFIIRRHSKYDLLYAAIVGKA